MIASLALIFLSGMAAASLCQGLRMPRLVGVLVAGIAAGQPRAAQNRACDYPDQSRALTRPG